MSTLTLSREQRHKLFEHIPVAIMGEGEPPVEKGHTHRLSPKVDLRITRVETSTGIKGGKTVKTWRLFYELLDRRDVVRLLRRTPTITSGDFDKMRSDRDEHGYPMPVPDGDAADESAYTSGGASAIVDAGEAPPRGWVEEHAKQCRLRDLKAVEDPKREANRLRDGVGRAKAKNIDISEELDAIRRANDEIRKKLEGEEAA